MQPQIPLAPSTLHTGLTLRARHMAICQSERTFAFHPLLLSSAGDKPAASERPASPPLPALPGLPTVEIEYCTGCRWLLRAAWLAQVCVMRPPSHLRPPPMLPRALPLVTGSTHKHIANWCARIQHAILAQELLTTFEGEIARVSLMPSMGRKDYPRGGVFDIR